MTSDDPLQELVVDADEFDRVRIVDALRGRLGIDNATSQPVVLPGFLDLDSAQKILAVMLVRKVGVLLKRADDDRITPTALAEQTGVPGGTIRRLVRELCDARQITQGPDGRYFVSGPQVGVAVNSLTAPKADDRRAESPAPTRAKRRRSDPRKSVSSSDTDAEASTRGARGASKRGDRSPTALVRDLVDGGFFDTPQTLAAVQRRLRDKTGHQIPVTTLSSVFTRLLRAEVLDREPTSDGPYAYSATRRRPSTP